MHAQQMIISLIKDTYMMIQSTLMILWLVRQKSLNKLEPKCPLLRELTVASLYARAISSLVLVQACAIIITSLEWLRQLAQQHNLAKLYSIPFKVTTINTDY